MRRSRAGLVARVVLMPLAVGALYLLKASEWFRPYPVCIVAVALWVFVRSLYRTPIVERIARGLGEELDERGVIYCRRVTQVWVAFLAIDLVLTLMTVFASPEVWALYNGCVAYVLMGLLLAVEWVVRRKVRHD